MLVWASHRVSEREIVTCPLCRVDWGLGTLQTIRKLLHEHQAAASKTKVGSSLAR
jgi:hypothetical protein